MLGSYCMWGDTPGMCEGKVGCVWMSRFVCMLAAESCCFMLKLNSIGRQLVFCLGYLLVT